MSSKRLVIMVKVLVLSMGLIFMMTPAKVKAKDSVPKYLNWLQINIKLKETFEQVVWSGEQFIVIGRRNTMLTSSDGIEWKIKQIEDIDQIKRISTVNNRFIISTYDSIYQSDNVELIKNNPKDKKRLGFLSDIYSHGSSFIGLTDGGILLSEDGADWEKISLEGVNSEFHLIINGSSFSINRRSIHFVSPDGKNWKKFNKKNLTSLTYWNGRYWATSISNPFLFLHGSNGWKLAHKPVGEGLLSFGTTHSILGTQKELIAYGSHVSWTTDGKNWDGVHLENLAGWIRDMAFGNDRFIAVGEQGDLFIGIYEKDYLKVKELVDKNNQKIERKAQ